MNGANLIQATLCVRKTFLAIFGDFPCIDDIHRHHLTAVFEKRCFSPFRRRNRDDLPQTFR